MFRRLWRYLRAIRPSVIQKRRGEIFALGNLNRYLDQVLQVIAERCCVGGLNCGIHMMDTAGETMFLCPPCAAAHAIQGDLEIVRIPRPEPGVISSILLDGDQVDIAARNVGVYGHVTLLRRREEDANAGSK